MADRQLDNIIPGEDDITNTSTISDFLSVSGDMRINSKFLFVRERESVTVGSEDDITSTSTRSDFLFVSGDMILESELPYVRETGSPTIRSDTTLSQHSGGDEGSSFIYFDAIRESVNSTSTYDPEDWPEYEKIQFLKPEDITPLSDTLKCFNCDIDGQFVKATHFCRSCRTNGMYICHRCLQSHNRWHHNHIVDSLSVFDTSSSIKAAEDVRETETPEICKRKKVSYDTLQQARPASDVTIAHGAKAKHIEHNTKTTKTIKQEESCLEKTTSRGLNNKRIERSAAGSKVKQRFFQDKLYTDIIKDMQCMKQESRSKLQKYGTYSVKSQSDTKHSVITSICKLGSGHLVLADSENCMIKILKEDNYQLVSSHKVEGHPALLCFIERGKLAVAFANNVIKIILIEKEIKVKNSFDVKRCCTGLTFCKGNLYVCVSERIDVYSETGEKRDSFRPSLSSNTDQKFVHLNKITMNKDKYTLYIADRQCGIVVADTSGNVKQIIDQYIAKPDAICADESGFLFVTEVSSDRVLKISTNDGSVIQVLKEVNKNVHPVSLCHDSITNRLIVGVWSSNDLHVYSCT